MDRARILVDFNALGEDYLIPISKTDSVIDSDGNAVVLSDGIEIYLYEDDYDVFDRQDNLIAEGIIVRNTGMNSIVKWYCQLNDFGVRHESDDPSFFFPELSKNEKRSIIYGKLEEWVSLIGIKQNNIVKGAIEGYIEVLRKIDNSKQ